jgi:hypothetical protein
MLSRRIAPILILMQISYVALMEIAFTVMVPDTAELDHTNPSASGRFLYTAVVIAVLITLAGGAALLGLDKARTRAPRIARTAWLVVLAIGELAIAGMFLASIARETFGPDTLIGLIGIVMCASITVASACELRTSLPPRSADARS